MGVIPPAQRNESHGCSTIHLRPIVPSPITEGHSQLHLAYSGNVNELVGVEDDDAQIGQRADFRPVRALTFWLAAPDRISLSFQELASQLSLFRIRHAAEGSAQALDRVPGRC